MTTCTTCGATSEGAAAYCAACGAALPSAAGSTLTTTEERARPTTLSDLGLALVRGNWVGAAGVAVATAFTAGLLGLVLALLAKPTDFGISNTLALATVIATGAFGADLQLSFSTDAEEAFVDLDGSASLGTFPLTVTLLSLLVAVLVFRRVTRDYPSRLVALGDAGRTALLLGVCLAVPALVFTADNDELGRGWGREASADVVGYELDASASALGAFGLGFLLLLTVLGLSVLVRRSHGGAPTVPGLGHERSAMVHAVTRPVVGGLVTLMALLPVAGGIGYLSLVPGEDSGSEVTGEGVRTATAFVVGSLGNAGTWLLSLGAGAPVGGSLEATGEPSTSEYSRLWGEATESEPGLWVAPFVLLGVLVLTTYVVLRLARREHALPALGAWLLSLVVVVPVLVRMSSVHVGLLTDAGAGDAVTRYRLDGVAGPEGVQTTLLVLLLAALVALGLAFATGRADPRRVRDGLQRVGAAVQRNPSGAGPRSAPVAGHGPDTTRPDDTSPRRP